MTEIWDYPPPPDGLAWAKHTVVVAPDQGYLMSAPYHFYTWASANNDPPAPGATFVRNVQLHVNIASDGWEPGAQLHWRLRGGAPNTVGFVYDGTRDAVFGSAVATFNLYDWETRDAVSYRFIFEAYYTGPTGNRFRLHGAVLMFDVAEAPPTPPDPGVGLPPGYEEIPDYGSGEVLDPTTGLGGIPVATLVAAWPVQGYWSIGGLAWNGSSEDGALWGVGQVIIGQFPSLRTTEHLIYINTAAAPGSLIEEWTLTPGFPDLAGMAWDGNSFNVLASADDPDAPRMLQRTSRTGQAYPPDITMPTGTGPYRVLGGAVAIDTADAANRVWAAWTMQEGEGVAAFMVRTDRNGGGLEGPWPLGPYIVHGGTFIGAGRVMLALEDQVAGRMLLAVYNGANGALTGQTTTGTYTETGDGYAYEGLLGDFSQPDFIAGIAWAGGDRFYATSAMRSADEPPTLTLYELRIRFEGPPLRQWARDDGINADAPRELSVVNHPTSMQRSIRVLGPGQSYA